MLQHRTMTNKLRNTAALLLMLLVTLMPFTVQPTALLANVSSQAHQTAINSPSTCHQQKSANAAVRSFCHSIGGAELYTIPTDFFLFFRSVSGKIYFLFIMGLLAASHSRRIFKPPKLQFCA